MLFQISSFLFKIEQEDKFIIRAVAQAFSSNDRMKFLIGKRCEKFTHQIKVVIAFCYFMVKKLGGIFYSQDRSTFLFYYRKTEYYFSWRDIFRYLYLAFSVIGITRIGKILRREKMVKQTRTEQINRCGDKDYLYVWFLAQTENCNQLNGLFEAKTFILKKAAELNLSIYIETTEERLLKIYERMGFQFYDYKKDEEADLEIWFARCAPPSKNNSPKKINYATITF